MARILHIDGDEVTQLEVKKLLEPRGHKVTGAKNALFGLALAREQDPEMILFDSRLPDLDGHELILRLRAIPKLASVPLVVLSVETERDIALTLGADGVLQKPVDVTLFARSIDRFLTGFRELSEEQSQEMVFRETSFRLAERLEKKVAELSVANQHLEKAVRIRQEFLRNVSHELATPMTPVVGYIKLLLNKELGPMNEMQEKCLRSVESSVYKLRALIDTLLDVSSLETGNMVFKDKEFELTQLVSKCVEQSRYKLQEKLISVHEEATMTLMPVVGDQEKLRRVFAHLIDNAIKFTPKGGHVAVAVRKDEQTPCYYFMVADTGAGIPNASIEEITEPFVQLDGSVTRSAGGAGLGLAYCKKIADAIGGKLMIQSPPMVEIAGLQLSGTLVIFALPYSKASPSS